MEIFVLIFMHGIGTHSSYEYSINGVHNATNIGTGCRWSRL